MNVLCKNCKDQDLNIGGQARAHTANSYTWPAVPDESPPLSETDSRTMTNTCPACAELFYPPTLVVLMQCYGSRTRTLLTTNYGHYGNNACYSDSCFIRLCVALALSAHFLLTFPASWLHVPSFCDGGIYE